MGGRSDVIVYKSLDEFYPFYLTEHRDPVNRTLHFIGSSLVLVTLFWIIATGNWGKFYLLPLIGYRDHPL